MKALIKRLLFYLVISLAILCGLAMASYVCHRLAVNLASNGQLEKLLQIQRQEAAQQLENARYFKQSMLELRQQLNLPVDEYLAARQPAAEYDTLAMALGGLVDCHAEERLLALQSEVRSNPQLLEFYSANNLKKEEGADGTLRLTRNGECFFTLSCSETGICCRCFTGEEVTVARVGPLLLDFLKVYTIELILHYAKVTGMVQDLLELLKDNALSELFLKKQIHASEIDNRFSFLNLQLLCGKKAIVFLEVDKLQLDYRINGVSLRSCAAVKLLLMSYLQRSRVESEVSQLVRSDAFFDFLQSRQLGIERTEESRKYVSLALAAENSSFRAGLKIDKKDYSIELFDGTGGRLAIKNSKRTGEAAATGGFEIPEQLPQLAALNRETTNILLVGTHTKLTDSMIVLHGDHQQKKLTLFSLPRDLYYKGGKLNAVYPWYGIKQLLSDVSEITGLPVTRYILIDMYAFIDVINILGGVDVRLGAPLYDKQVFMYVDGVRYPFSLQAGEHHLDGYHALSYVRSRKTTSDFDRARRQQQVLVALKQKFMDLNVEDADKILQLINTVMTNVETNLTPLEVLSHFLKMRGYAVSFRNVLDTGNVLYSTWSNLYLLEDRDLDFTDISRGQYILLPRENDWGLIRWYIGELLKG